MRLLGLFLVSAFSACTTMLGQCDQRCKDRLDTASDWLKLLGVNSTESLKDIDQTSLRKALDDWKLHPNHSKDETNKGDAVKTKTALEGGSFTAYGALEPNWMERLARMPSFKTEIIRTPTNVYGVPAGSPTGTPASIFANPDHELITLGGSLDTGELFLNVANRLALCQNRVDVGDIRKNTKDVGDTREDTKLDKCRKQEYLKATRAKDYIERYASATVINVNVSQLPRYTSGIVLTPQTPAALQRWTYTVTGSITPAALFRSASELKAVAAFVEKNNSDEFPLVDPISILPPECKATTKDDHDVLQPSISAKCLIRLAAGNARQRAMLTFLPRVDVKAYTTFDYTKNGLATFVQVQDSNKPLYDVTFTWDMRNLFPSTQNRTDALEVIRSIQRTTAPVKPKSPAGVDSAELQTWRNRVAEQFMVLAAEPDLAASDTFWIEFRHIITTRPTAKQSDQ